MSGIHHGLISANRESSSGWSPGANTLLYLKMDDDATDSSGNGNNGTATSVSWAAGKKNNCASYSSGSKIDLASGVSTTWRTLSFWLKLNNYSTTNSMIATAAGATNYLCQFYSDGKVYMNIGGTAGSYNHGLTASDNGVWHNFVLTREGTNTWRMYKDKVSLGTITDSGTPVSFQYIGYGKFWSSYYVNGYIDEVIAESVGWTQTNVDNYYNSI